MKELSLEKVGKRLRQIRTQMGLTREEFAEQVAISPQFLAEIENGKKGCLPRLFLKFAVV